jgi:hypothetical protein
VQELQQHVHKLQDKLQEMERGRLQDAPPPRRTPTTPTPSTRQPRQPRSQAPTLPPQRPPTSNAAPSSGNHGEDSRSISHRRQLFIRTEAPLPDWALAADGARAARILRGAGIRLPSGVTSQLHRAGVTQAFVLSFSGHHDAQQVLEQALKKRLYQPGRSDSIKVQWKRPPREQRPSRTARSHNWRPGRADSAPCHTQRHHAASPPAGHYRPRDNTHDSSTRDRQPSRQGGTRTQLPPRVTHAPRQSQPAQSKTTGTATSQPKTTNPPHTSTTPVPASTKPTPSQAQGMRPTKTAPTKTAPSQAHKPARQSS